MSIKRVSFIEDLTTRKVFVQLSCEKYDGAVISERFSRSQFLSPRLVSDRLADAGSADIKLNKARLEGLAKIGKKRVRFEVSRIGWRAEGFAYPRRTLRRPDGKKIYFSRSHDANEELAHLWLTGGEFTEWRRLMAEHASKSSYIIFSLGTVFASPLLSKSGLKEGATFNLSGLSTSGKTLAQQVAQSAMGSGDKRHLMSWDATTIGLVRLIQSISGATLIIDDVSRDKSSLAETLKRIQNVAHDVANGGRRFRAREYENQHGVLEKRLPGLALSSAELTKRELAGLTGDLLLGGSEVRFIDIPVPARDDGGIFDLADRSKRLDAAAEHAKALEKGITEHYGRAFSRYLRWLEKNQSKLEKLIDAAMKRFGASSTVIRPEAPNAFKDRIARKFELVAAGLVIAVKAGVIPLTEEECFAAVETCLRAAIQGAHAANTEIDQAVNKLKLTLADKKRVPIRVKGGGGATPLKRKVGDFTIAYLTDDDVADICGLEVAVVPQLVARLVQLQAFSTRVKSNRPGGKTQIKIGNGRRIDAYAFRSTFWRR